MITVALVDEGEEVVRYIVTAVKPSKPNKYFEACKTIGRYDDASPLLVQLWANNTLLINPARVIWTMHEEEAK